MAKKRLDIIIKARDEASKKFGKVGGSARRLSGTLRNLAMAGGAFLSARAIKNFAASSIEAFMEQEAAAKSLSDALNLLGQNSAGAMADMKAYAAEIQKQTVIGDEAVLRMMAMGSALGKLSGEGLKRATTAAIGLSRRLSIDTVAAMRLVARAAVGDTAQLKRYGVVLEEGLLPQEKFNQLLKIGASSFRLAAGEIKTYRGQLEQLKNEWGDFKEDVGGAMADIAMQEVKGFKAALDLFIPRIKEPTLKKLARWQKENKEKAVQEYRNLAEAISGTPIHEKTSGADIQKRLKLIEELREHIKSSRGLIFTSEFGEAIHRAELKRVDDLIAKTKQLLRVQEDAADKREGFDPKQREITERWRQAKIERDEQRLLQLTKTANASVALAAEIKRQIAELKSGPVDPLQVEINRLRKEGVIWKGDLARIVEQMERLKNLRIENEKSQRLKGLAEGGPYALPAVQARFLTRAPGHYNPYKKLHDDNQRLIDLGKRTAKATEETARKTTDADEKPELTVAKF